ncbi:hypothetical protein [Bradyrhizobium sp. F1.13.3]|uniref:hypothetical protein n=1 Tax=Bradyrhizobium sp. F1.13.3 TaxID=3156351 RepID=UPI0033919467
MWTFFTTSSTSVGSISLGRTPYGIRIKYELLHGRRGCMGRLDIDFRDLRPQYDIEIAATTRHDLKKAGCREETIAKMFPHRSVITALVPPESWFWTDRSWFVGWPKQVVDDIYGIAGGCFADMSVEDQTHLLGVEIVQLRGKRSDRHGLWLSGGDPVTVEQYALEALEKEGRRGIFCENHVPSALSLMTKKRYEALFNLWLGFDDDKRRPYTPSAVYTERAVVALRDVLRDPEAAYEKHRLYFEKLWDKTSLSDVFEYISIVSEDFIETQFRHRMDRNLLAVSGSPDLALRAEHLQFREVKAMDRMLGSQGLWVKNFARPLSLDYGVVLVRSCVARQVSRTL